MSHPLEATHFVPGDNAPLETLIAEVREQFVEWISARNGFTILWGEEALVETALVFRNMVDEGHMEGYEGDPKHLFYSVGAMVGKRIARKAIQWDHLNEAERKQAMQAADEKFGVNPEPVDYYYESPTNVEPALDEVMDRALEKLNPECRKVVEGLSRTHLKADLLGEAMGYKNQKGLEYMQNLCMERFAHILQEELNGNGK